MKTYPICRCSNFLSPQRSHARADDTAAAAHACTLAVLLFLQRTCKLETAVQHNVELVTRSAQQHVGEAQGERHSIMEIQPAEADAQRDETVLLIREDDSGAADGEPGGGNGSSSGVGGRNGSMLRQQSRRARLQRQGLVETVDGDRVPAEVAQSLCRKSKRNLVCHPDCTLMLVSVHLRQHARHCSLMLALLPCAAVYHGGFALLPLLWLVNVWLFWPDFRHGHDPMVAKCKWHSSHRAGGMLQMHVCANKLAGLR